MTARVDLATLSHEPGNLPNTGGRICTYVDALACFPNVLPFSTTDPKVSRMLECIRGILKCGYGYHQHASRLSRCAPSAGARYPTEIVVHVSTTSGKELILYHFESDCFYELPNTSGGINPNPATEDTVVHLFAISVLWRTAQRYGMRAHQYCVVDGAIVISNLFEVCRDLAIGAQILSLRASNALIENDVPQTASVIGGLVLTLPNGSNPPTMLHPPGMPPVNRVQPSEDPPTFSPMLRRLEIKHHKAVCEGRFYSISPESPSAPHRQKLKWATLRTSLRDNSYVRLGVMRIISIGMAFLLISIVIVISGLRLENFFASLLLLGVGWNFGFIGATYLLAQAVSSAGRRHIQGINDTIIALGSSVAALLSGALLTNFGWSILLFICLAFVFTDLLILLFLHRASRTSPVF